MADPTDFNGIVIAAATKYLVANGVSTPPTTFDGIVLATAQKYLTLQAQPVPQDINGAVLAACRRYLTAQAAVASPLLNEAISAACAVYLTSQTLTVPPDFDGRVIAACAAYLAGSAPATTLDIPASSQVVYSVKKVTGWAGNFGIAQKVGTGTQQTIGWGADNYFDTAALETFAAGADIEWVRLYDLSGNARDWIGSSGPLYNPAARNQWGQPSFCFSPKQSTASYNMALPAGVAGNRQALTVVNVDAVQAGLSNTGVKWGLGSGGTDRLDFCCRPDNYNQILNTASFLDTGLVSRCQPEVNITAAGASDQIVHVDGQTATIAANTNTAWTGGWIAHSAFGWNYVGDYFFFGIWNSQLAPAVITTLKTNLYAAFNVATARTMNVITAGDSLEFGQFSDYGRNVPRTLDGLLTIPAYMSNMSVPGRTAETCLDNWGVNVGAHFKAGMVNHHVIQEGTNDIQNGTTAANLWANFVLPEVQADVSAGIVPWIETIPPRGSFSAPMEAERLAYNAIVRDPTTQAANGYTCIDVCANAAFDAVPDAAADYNNTAVYWTDTVHGITSGMYLIKAQIRAAAINSPPIFAAFVITDAGDQVTDETSNTVILG